VHVTEAQPAEHCLSGGAGIGRLLIGSDEPEEVIQQENLTCSGAGQSLARVIFPNLYPMLSQWDEV
jgi:hypothetical protein